MKLIILIVLLMESISSKEDIKKELVCMGLDEKMVDTAMKLCSGKDDIAALVFQMQEDPELYQDLTAKVGNAVSNVKEEGIEIKDCYKMVIVVREDLNMSKGKTAAQVGHAVLIAYKKSMLSKQTVVNNWELYSGQKKVVLGCKDEAQMLEIQKKANERGIISGVVRDAGKTEVEPNTMTCMALGPDIDEEIDKVTGDLKLL